MRAARGLPDGSINGKRSYVRIERRIAYWSAPYFSGHLRAGGAVNADVDEAPNGTSGKPCLTDAQNEMDESASRRVACRARDLAYLYVSAVIPVAIGHRSRMIDSIETIPNPRAVARPATAAPPVFDSIVTRIARHAAVMPSRAAIVDGATTLSWEEFDARANQLANYLIEIDAGKGFAGVLLFDRSADFVIAALAVMKAGGAYVPMDSATPVDRVAMVLADSGAQILLTHHGKAAGVTAGTARVVELDGVDGPHIAAQPRSKFADDPASDDLSYLVYTSGSTGRPKGCEMTHANLICLLDWHTNAFGVTPADRASHVAGLGFDVVVWELWPNLSAGATLYIVDEKTRRCVDEFQRWAIERKITILFAPTTLAEQLLQMEWHKTAPVRWLIMGGEALHRRPQPHFPFSVGNCYGPAECTVVATSGKVSPYETHTPTIGWPIPRTTAPILDENLRPVPVGEMGELCLAGAHVGRGYRNNPELTAKQFVMYTPADGSPPVRVYRTGDRARQLANGEIEFHGRFDDQIKIRSYRIEPGEISAWIDKLPSIKKSIVIARDLGIGPELVAYVVAKGAKPPALNEIRDFVSTKVPEYMVPSHFALLPAFPMTPNGKIDRKALPLPSASNALPAAAGATPPVETTASDGTAADLQTRVTAVVAGLLGKDAINSTDNFLMLGGDSMLAAQIAVKVRQVFGVKVSLGQLFSAPTAQALCEEINRLQAKEG